MEEQKNNQQQNQKQPYNNSISSYVIIVGLVIVILAFGFVLYKLIQVNSICVNNPLTYGANRIEEQTKQYVGCTCDLGQNYNKIFFDKNNITQIYLNNGLDRARLDVAGLFNNLSK